MTPFPDRDTGLEPELEPHLPTPRRARRRRSRALRLGSLMGPLLAAAAGAGLLGLGGAGMAAGWFGGRGPWLAVAALGAASLAAVWRGAVGKALRERALVERGEVARAVVTASREEVRYTAHVRHSRAIRRIYRWQTYAVEYRFCTAAGEEVTGRAGVGVRKFLHLREGSRVTVLYDPADPRRRHVLYPLAGYVALRGGE